jgi:SecD/SecF fusion protein
LREGKTEEAVKASYSWTGAMRSIVDANVTHILTGYYLFSVLDRLRFATTLLIGIITSLFTSIFIEYLLTGVLRKNNKLSFVTGFSKNFFTNFHFDFLGIKKWTYLFSAVVVIVILCHWQLINWIKV